MKLGTNGTLSLIAMVALGASAIAGCKHGKSNEQLCGEAYDEQFNSLVHSMQENAARYPNITPSGSLGLGERASFVTRCSALDAAVVRCLNREYGTAHRDECRAHLPAIMGIMTGSPRQVHIGDHP